jgi:hypothetical protein
MKSHSLCIFLILTILFVVDAASMKKCDVLVIKPNTPYYSKRLPKRYSGNKIAGRFNSEQYAFPADQGIGNDIPFRVNAYGEGCGCLLKDAPTYKTLTKIRVMIGSGWEEVFVETDSITPVKYEPHLTEYRPGSYVLYYVVDCVDAFEVAKYHNVKIPQFKNVFEFDYEFDDVWNALIEAIAVAQLPIDVLQKESGLLVTGEISDRTGNSMICKSAYDNNNQIKFNVFVKKLTDKTQVRINASFAAVRQTMTSPVIECYSSGEIEKIIYDKIDSLLHETPE